MSIFRLGHTGLLQLHDIIAQKRFMARGAPCAMMSIEMSLRKPNGGFPMTFSFSKPHPHRRVQQ